MLGASLLTASWLVVSFQKSGIYTMYKNIQMPKHIPSVCIFCFLLSNKSVIHQFMHINLQRSFPKESTGWTMARIYDTCWIQIFQVFSQWLYGLKQIHRDEWCWREDITQMAWSHDQAKNSCHSIERCIFHTQSIPSSCIKYWHIPELMQLWKCFAEQRAQQSQGLIFRAYGQVKNHIGVNGNCQHH